ncbi:septum formation initiator family protein [Streptomyces tropicalis]|uniref:Septum formation initiator family protein n=1 Tax=Streptomyces tropicalis TaxID=3034234 RepID=A0ABT5ZXH9_9ACTN|nr:septum formation initiator family protein [Streptomyces tropicalis]MDF3297104.1 septum formation initiator family protein [Streptomyces tropicalis]
MNRRPELRGRAARLARLLPAGRGQAARAPFVLLVVLLLGGGLIGLLVLNSALSEGAFQLDDLQKDTKSLTDEQQALQRDIDSYSAPDALQRRAQQLGMVPGGDPAFLGPGGTVRGVPSAAAAQAAPQDLPVSLRPPRTPAAPAAPGGSSATAPPASPAGGQTAVPGAVAPSAKSPAPAAPGGAPPTGQAAPTAGRAAPTTTPGR